MSMVVMSATVGAQTRPATPTAAKPDAFTRDVVPQLQKFCYECHGDGASAGDLELDPFQTVSDIAADKPVWKKIIQYVRTETMPPPEADAHPSRQQRDQLARAIEDHLYQIDPANPDPGHVAIRRLNRIEYRNIIRDLIGVGFDPTIDFPQDDTGYGFDNIADVLTLPPMLMEKYLAAADKVLSEAIPSDEVQQTERRIPATEARASFERDDRMRDGWVTLSSNQEDSLSIGGESIAPAEYVVRIQAYAKYPGPPPQGSTAHPPMKLSLMLGDAVVREFSLSADESNPQWLEGRVGIGVGRYILRAAVLRQRGPVADKTVSDGRIGREQPGSVVIKEIVLDGPVKGGVRRFAGGRIEMIGATAGRDGEAVILHRTGDEAAVTFDVGAEGKYLLRTQAFAEYAGNEPARMELLLDGKPLKTIDVNAPAAWKTGDLPARAKRAVPQIYEIESTLPPGKHRLVARFINNLKDESAGDPNYRDRNIWIQRFDVVELSAPPGSRPLPAPMRTLFAKHPDAGDARGLLSDFALRAWRRPPTPTEIDRVMKLYTLARDNGENPRASVRHAMKGILVSPSFLFHGDLASAGVNPDRQQSGNVVAIDEYELASRLSFYLWSSMPDDELLELAKRSQLRSNLDRQVKRMLASEKSRALVENFAGQWLQFRNLDAVHPDREKFEDYNDRLRDAMQRETTMFVESIVREDRSLMDILLGDYTFVNDRLARHYGIEGVTGQEFRKVSLADTPRRGVLTQGSVLTLTSNPTRTSPVKRGKWVLENLLGVAPPPPPADVPSLDSSKARAAGKTLRQRLEVHRADPNCASCHAPMDPIGFALENFDPIGRFRTKDGGETIDASGELMDGQKFTGSRELIELLATTRRDDFLRASVEASLTFALGRGVEPTDRPAVDRIIGELNRDNARFSTLVMGVVTSVPFQKQRIHP